MNFTSDIVIGMEIHVELATKSKLFCSCARKGKDDEEPNTRCCPVCLGHPGSKPVLNKKAVEYALKLALALNCDISPELIFSRKSYFYPDLAKNYQITQYEIPLGLNGKLKLSSGKEVGIERVHIEEDPASLVHPAGMQGSSYVLVDYNRSGDPLCEIVTKPELTSPDEAREFMKKLLEVINYLDIFDIDHCIIKADANISIKESGYVRAEVKNVTGFKEIERALEYEVLRQKQAVKEGKKFVIETRGWDPEKGTSFSMRTKESEADYGYILDPDLTITDITEEMIEETKKNMPELAQDKVEKYISQGIDKVDSQVLATNRQIAELFDEIIKEVKDPVMVARWLRRELLRVLNYNKMTMKDIKFNSKHLIELLKLLEEKKITENTSKKIIEELVTTPFDIHEYIKNNNLEAVSDRGEITKWCQEVIDENPQAIEELKAGNNKSMNFLMGMVMRKSKGKATPKQVMDTIKELNK